MMIDLHKKIKEDLGQMLTIHGKLHSRAPTPRHPAGIPRLALRPPREHIREEKRRPCASYMTSRQVGTAATRIVN